MLRINEVFSGLQGEGIHQGLPMAFIRFQGCNLLTPCSYCDTAYAQRGDDGTNMEVEEVVNRVKGFAPYYRSWICITGGEPLFQKDGLHSLVKWLRRYGFKTTVETNGSLEKPQWYTLVDSWVADIKCPSSGVGGVSSETWFDTRVRDQVKFVVGTQEDLDFARKAIKDHMASAPVVLVSPVSLQPPIPYDGWDQEKEILYTGYTHFDSEWLQEVAEFCKEVKARMSIQLHKVVWGLRRGV